MVTVVQRWSIHPGIPWLRGVRPESDVEYNEQLNAWFVYGYDAVFGIVNDPKTFSSRTAQLAAVTIDESFNEGDVSQLDPPEQTRYRKLISRAFTPKVVSGLESRITQIADELLDGMRDKERIDLVAELAYPLPVIVIAELLGIPSTDRELFIAHSTRFVEQLNGLSFLDESAKEDIGYAVEGFQPMMDYMREQLAERRRRPGQDLISGLAAAEQDGRRLTDNEIVNLSNLLLVAGHITTTMMIGNTVLCLDASPDQFARVREDRSLVAGALEESVRVLSPTAALSRRTTREVEIAGVRVPAEQMLLPWLAAANRDPRRFADPDRFDVGRDPNPHLGFGHGVHYCVGAMLARVESRIALNRLLDRFPKLYVDPNEPPEFFPNPDLIGVRSLPMRTG